MQLVHSPWQMWRLLLILLAAAVVFACLFSMMLPASASLLAPTATLTRTATLTPTVTLAPTLTLTPLPAHLITPNVTEFTTYTVYFQRDLWESAAGGPFGIEDFEKDPFDYGELPFPYFTGNRFILTGTSTAQILLAPELLASGNLIHFRDFEQGLTFTFPNDAAVTAFGFDYTSSEDWLLTFNHILTPLSRGRNRFVGVVMRQDETRQFVLSGPQTAQGGLSVDNIMYATFYLPSTPTSTPEPDTP
jgi:hypothetical protein